MRVEPLDKTRGHIMIDGNTAAALGCVYAGATVGAWYPITPSTSLMDAFKGFCERYRKDPKTGEKLYCIVQAEDELAAIGIVLGATWNGARAFTPDQRSGLVADERVPGLRVFHGAARGRVRRPASRTLDRHADAHAASRHPFGGIRVARRHEARAAVSERSARVLRDRGSGVRSRRAAADAGDRVVRSRHRHERLDVQGPRVGSRLSAGPRQGPERRAARRDQGVPSLCRCRRRRDPVPDAARRASEGRVLRARLGSQPARPLHRGLGRIPASRRSARRRSGAPRRSSCPKPVVRRAREGREVGAHRRRQLGRRDPRGARAARAERHPRRLLPHTRLPVRQRRWRSSSSNTSGFSSSSRIATRSSRACSRSSSVAILRVCTRSCNMAACRSTAAASSTRSSRRPRAGKPHDVDRETEDRPSGAQAQRARPHDTRLRGRHVDALRRLRPRLDHRGDRAGVLRARHRAA